LALGVIFVLGNTLRLSIEARRDEIIVIKLIGGGDRFARRPFLYSGLWLGALGGLVSCVVVLLIGSSIAPATEGLFELYDRKPLSLGLSPELAILLSGAGAAIGWLSAFVSVSVHLTKIQPR
jgi:cell division transport system permease protein